MHIVDQSKVNVDGWFIRVAGNWLFFNRRWLDPRRKDDLELLNRNYNELCASFPPFEACSRDKFMHVLEHFCTAWTAVANPARKPRPTDCKPEGSAGHQMACRETALSDGADEPDEDGDPGRLSPEIADPVRVGSPGSSDNAGEQVDLALLALWAGEGGPLGEAGAPGVLERSASL